MTDRERSILLVGATGQIGRRLVSTLGRVGRVITASRADADLERPSEVQRLVRSLRPHLVVNAAAYTAVDAAESDAKRARAVNADAPASLSHEAAEQGTAIIHLSTNYVFDGTLGRAYRESDEPNPVNVYGTSKLEGEQRVAAANPAHVIVRTAAVYDSRGANFVRRIRELAREREYLEVVDDQLISPTPASVVAEGVAVIAARLVGGSDTAVYGIYHLTARGQCSWCEFAARVLAADPRRGEHRSRELRAVTSDAFPAAARRPANGVLDTSLASRRFSLSLPDWDDAFTRFTNCQPDE